MKKTVNTMSAREGMTAADVLTLSGEDLQTLAAAAVENAMKRREADSGRDLVQMRAKYQEDARQEAICEMYARAAGEWIEGETADGTPRAALPLAYFAAICAGSALDRLMYQDGGHAVKLTAREARENYKDAPELAELAEAVKAAEAAEAEAPAEARKEAREAVKAAKRDLNAAAAELARAAVVVETRRTSSPVAPGPEGALLESERLERVFSHLPAEIIGRAADMAREIYEGAESVREAARIVDLPEATARRTWQAVRDAARAVLIEDGDTAALERMNDEEHARRAAKNRAAKSAAEARRADEIKAAKIAPSGAVRFTAGRPDRLAHTAKTTPAALAKLARLFYEAGASRPE